MNELDDIEAQLGAKYLRDELKHHGRTGGPAFPHSSKSLIGSGLQDFQFAGMTLRDYFAGQALLGLITHVKLPSYQREVAAVSYQYADAMLRERIKQAEQETEAAR